MVEDLALPAQHIRPVIDEPLIQELPHLPLGALVGGAYGSSGVRHGVCRIRDVLVKRVGRSLGRWREGEHPTGAQVELRRRDSLVRRPLVERPPLVHAGNEDLRLRALRHRLAVQPVPQPAGQNGLAKIGTRIAAEIDVSELSPRPAGAAVVPRADHQIVAVLGVAPFQELIDLERSIEVLLIPPAGDVQDRNGRLGQMGGEGLLVPERVPIRVRHEVIPARQLAMEVAVVDIGKGSQREVPLIGVQAIELELGVVILAQLEQGRVLEAVAQAERAVVMGVIADELIGRRGILDDRLERRVGVEQRHGGGPGGIGSADHPGAAIIIRDVVEEPLDRVVGIGALVGRTRIGAVARRALHHERPLGLEPSAQVLDDVDVAVRF